MTKQELLQEANTHLHLDSLVRKLAEMTLTTEEAGARHARIKAQQKKIGNAVRFARYAGFLAIVALSYVICDPTAAQVGAKNVLALGIGMSLVTLLGSAVWTVLSFVARDGLTVVFANESLEWALQPIAGTSYCEKALEYLQKGGAHVAAWRDVALTERDQLHHYDVAIMESLADIYAGQEREREYRERMSEACKQVHGFQAPAQAV